MQLVKRTLFILSLILGLFLLGFWGVQRLDAPELRGQITSQIYSILQLFVAEGDWMRGKELPWQLEVVRFLAPVSVFASAVLLFARDAWLALTNATARFYKDHIVLVGLNDYGWQFVQSCRRHGRRVVVVELDAENRLVAECVSIGVGVIFGDALDEDVLKRAGIAGARHLVVLTSADGTNVEVTLRTKRLLQRLRDHPPWFTRWYSLRGADPLKIHLHLADTLLATRLEGYPKFFRDPEIAEVMFFNVYELSARLLFRQQFLELYADVLCMPQVHVAIFGSGPLAQQVLLCAVRVGHFADFQQIRISVFSGSRDEDAQAFRAAYPQVEDVCNLGFYEARLHEEEFIERLPSDVLSTVTTYVVALDDDQRCLNVALMLRQAILKQQGLNAPIMVEMQQSDGLAQLLESRTGEPELPDGLYPFGMLDEILDAQTIIDERLDALAHGIHEAYLQTLDPGARPTVGQQPWNRLPEWLRKENRLQADHIDVKLRAVESTMRSGSSTTRLTDREISRIAQMEQRRYVASRLSFGWRYGKVRNDLAKVHPLLRPWDQMPADEQEWNRAQIRGGLESLKKRMGRAILRQVKIGVTGHRWHKLNGSARDLERAVERALRWIAERHPESSFVVMSPLAEGADRVVARIALDVLDAELHVPLPLPYELYSEDFGETPIIPEGESNDEFMALVGRATQYYELPLRFGSYADLSREVLEDNEARNKQYALAGAYVVQRCHEMIAVWDGCEEDGIGGTAQMVRWRLQGVPSVYAHPDIYYPTPEKRPPIVIPPDAGGDFQPAFYSAATEQSAAD
ncbi:MAG: NAD-binding protein [Gammaproteobacteria bacterium]